MQSQELPTDNFLAEPELRTRFVRYFQFIASNIPMGTFSPMVQALSRRLFPLFAKELEKFSDEDIERTGVVALLTMAKLYRPNAERVVLDFAKGTMEVLGTEAVPPALVEDDDRMLLEAADNELLTPPVPDFANMQVVDEDPIIGVQLPDGSVVQMRQADYLSLMKGGADNAVE